MVLWHLKTRLLILGGVHCSFYCHPFSSSSQTPFALAKGVKASNLVLRSQKPVRFTIFGVSVITCFLDMMMSHGIHCRVKQSIITV